MDEDRTSLSGTHSNDTIIELTGATAVNENVSPYDTTEDDTMKKNSSAGPSLEAQESPRGAVVAPGLMLLDLLKLKKRKLGHRRINEEGEITFKKIQTSWIVGSIQLGIGQAVGSLASKPERDLLMMDFALVETTSFPKEGGPITPAHRYSDFKFRAYAPVAFRYFRDLFGIKPDDFLLSLCSRPMLQLTNPGASGSIFYVTDDDNFILKTVDHREAEFLQKLLPGYYMNINQNPRTLLPKFFGLYCYQCSNKNVRLVVMNNLLPSVKMHEKYDLKGSTYKRKAGRGERKKSSPTYKDLDFLERHPDGIFLEPETYSALMGTMKRDCRVLESFKIMDYSLLVGVHNLDLEGREEDGTAAANRPLARSRSMNRQRLAAFSTALESIRADVDVQEGGHGEEDVPPGGIPARNAKGERLLLFLGIIDILQSFVLKKRLEHTLKAIVHDGDTVSVHRPGFYAQRFLDFMANEVFKKTPSPLKHTPSRRKGRKTSAAPRSDQSFEERIITKKETDPATFFATREELTPSHPDQIAAASFVASEDLVSSHPDQIAAVSFDAREDMMSTHPDQITVPGPSFHTREDHSDQIRDSDSTSPKLVRWAEKDVLELSQVVIETVGGGSPTPTHTEGTPSLTESSPSPTTPIKSINKSFDSLGPLNETRVQ